MEEKFIYGIRPVLEALRAERQVLNKVLIVEGRESPTLRSLRQMAREKDIPVHIRSREALSSLAGTENHQGVVGITAGSPYSTWDDLLDRIKAAEGRTIVLILDSVEDPQNLGSLIRTAEASGVQGIILPKDRAVGITPVVVKASAGAVAHLPVIRVTNLANALEDLKKEGFWIVGADPQGDHNLYEMKFDMNVGLVIGSEGKGVRPLVLKKCDYRVSIPLKGKISSLNAAIAGAVILFEIRRQQLFMPSG